MKASLACSWKPNFLRSTLILSRSASPLSRSASYLSTAMSWVSMRPPLFLSLRPLFRFFPPSLSLSSLSLLFPPSYTICLSPSPTRRNKRRTAALYSQMKLIFSSAPSCCTGSSTTRWVYFWSGQPICWFFIFLKWSVSKCHICVYSYSLILQIRDSKWLPEWQFRTGNKQSLFKRFIWKTGVVFQGGVLFFWAVHWGTTQKWKPQGAGVSLDESLKCVFKWNVSKAWETLWTFVTTYPHPLTLFLVFLSLSHTHVSAGRCSAQDFPEDDVQHCRAPRKRIEIFFRFHSAQSSSPLCGQKIVGRKCCRADRKWCTARVHTCRRTLFLSLTRGGGGNGRGRSSTFYSKILKC